MVFGSDIFSKRIIIATFKAEAFEYLKDTGSQTIMINITVSDRLIKLS